MQKKLEEKRAVKSPWPIAVRHSFPGFEMMELTVSTSERIKGRCHKEERSRSSAVEGGEPGETASRQRSKCAGPSLYEEIVRCAWPGCAYMHRVKDKNSEISKLDCLQRPLSRDEVHKGFVWSHTRDWQRVNIFTRPLCARNKSDRMISNVHPGRSYLSPMPMVCLCQWKSLSDFSSIFFRPPHGVHFLYHCAQKSLYHCFLPWYPIANMWFHGVINSS